MTERGIPNESELYLPFPDRGIEELKHVQSTATLAEMQNDEYRLHSRRSFLKIAGKAAAVTGVALGSGLQVLEFDTHVGEMMNSSSGLRLERIASSSDPRYAYAETLLIPGFNVRSAVPAAEAIKAQVAKYGHVSALTHAGNRFNIDDLAAATQAHIKESGITSLTLLGSSLGGVIAVELASRVKEVDLIIADSSPADPSDALGLPDGFLNELTENVSWALDTLDLSGGPVLRTTTEFIKRMHDGDKSTLKCLQEALAHDYSKSCPNPLVLDLYVFMMTHNIQARRDIGPEVAMVYMGVDDSAKDSIVNQTSAVEKYRQFAIDRQAPFAHVTSSGTGHADIAMRGDAYAVMHEDGMDRIAYERRSRLRRSIGTVGYRVRGW